MGSLVWAAATLSVVFAYLLGRLILSRTTAAALAAALLATMPLLVNALQPPRTFVLPLPFILAWLICIERDRQAPRTAWLAGAGAALGLGLFSHETAVVMMPALLASTLLVLVVSRGLERRDLVLGAAFALSALPFVVFLVLHPTYISDHVRLRGLYDGQRFTLLQGLREMSSWVGLTARSESYWDYFDPALLFLSHHGIREALRHPDVFYLPFVVGLPVGLYRIATVRQTVTSWLLLAAFVLAPLSPALLAERPVAGHLLLVAPAAALIAARGWDDLMSAASSWRRILASLTLIATALNAVWFLAAAVSR